MSDLDYTDIKKRLTHATVAPGPAPVKGDRPAPKPTLTPEQIADNMRRLRYPVLVTEHPDGTHSFKHDVQVREGRIASTNTDRGAYSIGRDALRDEQKTVESPVESSGPARDEHGRFAPKEEAE